MSTAKKRKSKWLGGAFPLGPFDEVFAPARYEAQLQWDAAVSLPAPAPVPGGKDREDVYRGRVTIELEEDES